MKKKLVTLTIAAAFIGAFGLLASVGQKALVNEGNEIPVIAEADAVSLKYCICHHSTGGVAPILVTATNALKHNTKHGDLCDATPSCTSSSTNYEDVAGDCTAATGLATEEC